MNTKTEHLVTFEQAKLLKQLNISVKPSGYYYNSNGDCSGFFGGEFMSYDIKYKGYISYPAPTVIDTINHLKGNDLKSDKILLENMLKVLSNCESEFDFDYEDIRFSFKIKELIRLAEELDVKEFTINSKQPKIKELKEVKHLKIA